MTSNTGADVSIDDDAELEALEGLLSILDGENEQHQEKPATGEIPTTEKAAPRLREDSTFAEAFSYEVDLPADKLREISSKAVNKNEELDSSDDDEVRNFLDRKYNEYGCDINKRLKQQKAAQHENSVAREVNAACQASQSSSTSTEPSTSCYIKNPHNPIKRQAHSVTSTSFKQAPAAAAASKSNTPSVTTPVASATFTDPVFGLRIINPLVSSTLLTERMKERNPVSFAGIAFHSQQGDLTKDWVIAGVLVNKSAVRLSKKGTPYSIWRLSDLRGDIKMVSLFLFSGAHKELWKTAEGMCLAVLNPSILDKRSKSDDQACLSIDTAQKVMILGQSKDFGTCTARKKNGDRCAAIINTNHCDVCVYHMKQEYGKLSRRSELQSSSTGRGLNDLRNKVLGKSEVFYGGQSFTAIPAKKSAKMVQRDSERMSTLSEYAVSPFANTINHTAKSKTTANAVPYAPKTGHISKLAGNVETSTKQRCKDLERLKILQAENWAPNDDSLKETVENATTTKTTTAPSTSQASSTPLTPSTSSSDLFKNRTFSFSTDSPKLSRDNFSIEVNIGERKAQAAKVKAIQAIKQRPLEKVNPNSVRGSKEGKRRAIDVLNDKFTCSAAKRQKMEEERLEAEKKTRIQRIMDATSSHSNLINAREREQQEKYFFNLERKEALEEKMLNTYKVPCKAVICKQCKYTAFSAAERCKAEMHPLKVIDAEKRFFQCKDCGNRTATVFKLPKTSCKNCQGSRWERAAMIRERKVPDGTEGLSLRGDEEMFLGSVATKANLNLLVPDE